MAKTKIEVDLVVKGGDSVGQVEGKVVSLKTQLKQMKAELASGNLTGAEFDKMARAAGELEDRIGDVTQRVKNLASDSQKLEGFVSIAQGIVGGFAAVQGITALVGTENEELQKTMVKLQGAMSALAGIQAIANTLNANSAALVQLNAVKTGIMTVATNVWAWATEGLTRKQAALRVALLATGIGAIVAAIAFLIPLLSDWLSGTEDLKKAQDKLNASLKEADEDLANYTSEVEYNTKKEVLLAKQKGAAIENQRAIEKKGRQEELVLLLKDFNTKSKLLEDAKKIDVETLDKANEAFIESAKKFRDKSRENELKNIQDEIDDKKEIDDAQKTFDDKEKDRQTKRTAAAEKAKATKDAEDAKILQKIKDNDAIQREYAKEQAKILEEANIIIAEQNFTAREKEREAIGREFEEKIKSVEVGSEQEQALRDAWFIKLQESAKKYSDEEIAAKKESDEKIAANTKAILEKSQQDYINSVNAKSEIAKSSFDTLNSLGELALGQQFKQTAIGKTLALAQIATDTAVAISSAGVAAAKATAATGNPLSGVAVYVTTVAGILANVLRAKSILSGGGASGGSGGGGGGGGQQQNSNPPSITGFTRGTDAQGNPITKVVVLEKDITNSQMRVARIRTNAELI